MLTQRFFFRRFVVVELLLLIFGFVLAESILFVGSSLLLVYPARFHFSSRGMTRGISSVFVPRRIT